MVYILGRPCNGARLHRAWQRGRACGRGHTKAAKRGGWGWVEDLGFGALAGGCGMGMSGFIVGGTVEGIGWSFVA